MDVWEWLANLRRQAATWQRDDARRRDQGHRDGYARSGDPRPVPIYTPPGAAPAAGDVQFGIEAANVAGSGGDEELILDAQDGGRTWIMFSIFALDAVPGPTAGGDALLYVSTDGSSWTLVGTHDASLLMHATISLQNIRIPQRYLRGYFLTTALGIDYHIAAIWEENR